MNAIVKKQIAFLQSWPGDFCENYPLMRALNAFGSQYPIFWCFQNENEFTRLAQTLGNDIPLYALRSGHLLMEYSERNVTSLCSTYADHIIQVLRASRIENQKFLLAGNCQGAYLIYRVNRLLNEKNIFPKKLIVLESNVPDYSEIEVKLIYGRDSNFNPYKKFYFPAQGLKKYFCNFSTHVIPCGHGDFWIDTNLPHLRSAILNDNLLIERVKQPKAEINIGDTAYHAAISTEHGQLALSAEEACSVDVTVQNLSQTDWPDQYMTLGNHWLNAQTGSCFRWIDWSHRIPELRPGEKCTVTAQLFAPPVQGEFRLEFDLCNDGISWFKNQGSEVASIRVSVENQKSTSKLRRISISREKSENDLKIARAFRIGAPDRVIDAIYEEKEFAIPSVLLALETFIGNARIHEAHLLCEHLLEFDPCNPSAYSYLLKILHHLNDFSALEERSIQAIRIDPQRSEYYKYFLLSQIMTNKIVDEQAIEYKRLERSDLIVVLSAFFFRGKKSPDDLYHLVTVGNKLLNLDVSEGTYMNVTGALLKANAFASAEVVLKHAIQVHPNDQRLMFRLAECIANLYGFERAIEYYKKTITLYPFHRSAYKKIIGYLEHKDKNAALDFCNQAYSIFNQDRWFQSKLRDLSGETAKL